MEVQGKVKMIGETQTFGSNGFRKRELVVTTEEQYPQHILVEFVQDKTDLLNSFKSNLARKACRRQSKNVVAFNSEFQIWNC